MSKPLRIVAIDASGTATGWATNATARVESGLQSFPLRRGSSPGMRFHEFSGWIERLVGDHRPDVVVYEIAHHRGGPATELCVGFTTRVMEAAAVWGAEYRGVHTATLKAFAAGYGHASKAAMQAAAQDRFPHYDPARDEGADEADALCLLWFGMEGFPEVRRKRPARKRVKA
jgi:Holliday junction resolvasome RuvABC endonuclease subunit